ncbi:MAG TPA: thioredoxin family protein [Bacteroidetes bacterium]|nr:thioredoxin family protein [Bacteroidota bacterium]
MEIKVLGTGCPKCKALESRVHEALASLKIQADVQKEEDIMKIMGYGIIHTPGLVINNRVVCSGRVPSVNEIKDMINQNQ